MENYTNTETYTLPSKGKIYTNVVDPEITLRSMTTAEEMRRLSPSELPYRNMCDIVDECMVKDPGISSYDMCLGDYLFLLHRLRVVTYGSSYKMGTICPYCGCSNVIDVDLTSLPIKEYTEGFDKLAEFELPNSKKVIKLRYQTPRMLDNITQMTKEFKDKSKSKNDETLIFTLQCMIDTVDGKRPDVINMPDWIRNLPMGDTNTILAHAEELNNMIGIDTTIPVNCDTCGLTYNSTFKATSEFFRPALNLGR